MGSTMVWLMKRSASELKSIDFIWHGWNKLYALLKWKLRLGVVSSERVLSERNVTLLQRKSFCQRETLHFRSNQRPFVGEKRYITKDLCPTVRLHIPPIGLYISIWKKTNIYWLLKQLLFSRTMLFFINVKITI